MSDAPVSADEELIRFLAAPVPRVVPPKLRKAALREAGPGGAVLFGVIFLTMGLIFAKAFLPWRQVDEWRLAAGGPAVAAGRITAVERTSMSIDHARVMRYEFEFNTATGAAVRGECFTTGGRWAAGEPVKVRYAADRPELACPVGARLSEGSLGSAFVLIFPLAGAGLLVWVRWSRKRMLGVLQNGTLGDFRVTGIVPTGVEVNKQAQFKVTLQRLDQADAAPHEVRWYRQGMLEFARERLANGQAVFGLFDPAKPKKVVLPEVWSVRG